AQVEGSLQTGWQPAVSHRRNSWPALPARIQRCPDVFGEDSRQPGRLFRPVGAPAHAPQHGLAADAEIDDLSDHREYGEPRLIAFGVLAGRLRPELTEPLVHRLEYALVDRVERAARRRELAQYELHEVARLRPGDHELHHAPHAFEDARLCLMLRQEGRVVEPDSRARHAAYGIDDMLGAGRAQALLAAEVIGDRTDVGLRFRRYLAGRGGLEAFLSE